MISGCVKPALRRRSKPRGEYVLASFGAEAVSGECERVDLRRSVLVVVVVGVVGVAALSSAESSEAERSRSPIEQWM